MASSWVSFLGVGFLYPFLFQWACELFPCLLHCRLCYYKYSVTGHFVICRFYFFWIYFQKSIPGSYGRLIFNCLSRLHTDFHSCCTSLHSHQEWSSLLFSISKQWLIYGPAVMLKSHMNGICGCSTSYSSPCYKTQKSSKIPSN